jgi:hypothetical protein
MLRKYKPSNAVLSQRVWLACTGMWGFMVAETHYMKNVFFEKKRKLREERDNEIKKKRNGRTLLRKIFVNFSWCPMR